MRKITKKDLKAAVYTGVAIALATLLVRLGTIPKAEEE